MSSVALRFLVLALPLVSACAPSEPVGVIAPDAGDAFVTTPAEAGTGCDGTDSVGAAAKLDAALTTIVREQHLPGFSVAVVKKGRTVYAKGYGVSRADGQPQTARTVHLLASASKPVTAVAILQLVEQGKLRLDDDVNRHLSVFGLSVRNPKHPAVPITLRMLLTHTSSVGDSPASWDETYFSKGDSPISLREFVSGYFTPGHRFYGGRAAFTDYEPGAQSCYSNMGVGLLSLVVEAVTGGSFGDYCREHIFSPLGMHDTSFYVRDLADSCVSPRLSFGLAWDGTKFVADDYGRGQPQGHPEVASGMLRSTALDMARFVAALAGGGALDGSRILSTASVQELQRRQLSAAIPSCDTRTVAADQGLLGYYTKDAAAEYFGHAGGMIGVGTDFFIRLGDRAGFVVLGNATYDAWVNDAEIAMLQGADAL